MKSMEFGFLAVLLSVSYCAGFKSCFARKELKEMSKMMMNNRCMAPTDRFVQLEVPKEYAYVMPGTVKVKRCNGYCNKMKTDCLPTKTTTKTFNVEAKPLDERLGVKCTQREVEEHLECGCNCIITKDSCSHQQEFDEKSCSCLCKEELKEDCPDDWMWSSVRCECIPMD